MGIDMRVLFRKYGHSKGYCGEIFLAISYTLFFFGRHVKYNIIRPILIFLINTSDFECPEYMTHLNEFLGALDIFMFPLFFQVIFVSVMWQILKI